MEREYSVTGMSCAGCAARVEKGVSALAGVTEVQVNLLAKAMKVRCEGTTDEEIVAAVRRMGFGAEVVEQEEPQPPAPAAEPSLGRRAALSLALLAPLVLVHHLWHELVWVQLALVLPIVWINRSFYLKGMRALVQGGANMDTLVALGSGVALADGVVHLCMGTHGGYFLETSGMILTYISLGKWLEARATQRTGRAIEKLSALLPDTATLLRGGREEVVSAEQLRTGDIVLVRAGERISADGRVEPGCFSTVDEAALTGESMPVEKGEGAMVYAGTVNLHGALRIKVSGRRKDSALSGVIRLVKDAAASKAPVSRLADRLAAVFVPLVVALACVTGAVWALAGAEWDFSVARAVAVLVISCPCALGLATPVAIMVGAGRGAERGILFRSGEAMENAGRATCVVLDKTGTLTQGEPCVTDVLPRACSREELLQLAMALEKDSDHPLAKAIHRAAEGAPSVEVQGHTYLPGRGVRALVQGIPCAAGNAAFMRELGVPLPSAEEVAGSLTAQGKTLIYLAQGGEWMGTLGLADAPRPTAAAAVRTLQAEGLRVLMMTGDNARTARAIAEQVGVQELYADVLPADKEAMVRRLQDEGQHVAMVGDGINDAPALARADIGIALGAGTDIAMESAGIILMHSDPQDIARAIGLSRRILSKIRQNLFLALIYNLLAIPLAAGVFFPLCGLLLPPAVAAAAMGLSSICVVVNALLLRRSE